MLITCFGQRSKNHQQFRGVASSILSLIGHQPFWDFLKLLQNEERINWQKIVQFRAGRPRHPKKQYEDLATQLRNVVIQFAQNEPIDHLRNISRLIGNGTQFVNLNAN